MTIRSLAIYVPDLGGGGAERVAALLASGFQDAGVATTLLVDRHAEANQSFLRAGMRQVVLGPGHARSVLRLARWLSREQPEVVLAVDAPASLKLVAAQRLARSRSRTVISYHGFSPIVRGRLGRLAYRLAPLLSRLADRTVCVSECLARHLVTDWGAKPDRVVVAANPVWLSPLTPAADEATLRARPPTILAIGRLVPEKGMATLLAALLQLPADVRLEILGDGPEREALQATIATTGLRDRVALRGYDPEPWRAYASARVFALASTSESFGNVGVEALASGLPVVATDCGGPREILADGRYGSLVPVGDVDRLADALRRALQSPGDPTPRRERAAMFSVERAVASYVAVFADLPSRGVARDVLTASPAPPGSHPC